MCYVPVPIEGNLEMEANYLAMEKQLHEEAHEVSSKVDTTLASCSNKLANLENLLSLTIKETSNNRIGANGFENDEISEELIERTFSSDLISSLIRFELRELEDLFGGLQELIVDALTKISSFESSMELVDALVRRLHDSEELLEHSRDRALEMEACLAKLRMVSFSSEERDWNYGLVQTTEQKGILRMLEKSLSRELELEKNLKELKQNRDDLEQKVRLVEQVASHMEEAAEVAWARFLEADSTAEVLSGVSKDTLEKLRLAQANLNHLTKTEGEKTHQLQDLANQLLAKNAFIENLNSTISNLAVDNARVEDLREKVRNLEETLRTADLRLEEANTLNETSRKQLAERESEIEALREKTFAAETRAESAEEKASHLTESNAELSEEVDFLKGTNDINAKKASMLEKQLREVDIQLQHSRALSEASQDQQNMLYSAIWDMETLIDELKQKVAKAEGRAESAEGRCVILSETNSDISKELDFMRSRVELLENGMSQAEVERKSWTKDIGVMSGRITEMALQLAIERERVQEKLISCTMQNKSLREMLMKQQKNASLILTDKKKGDEEEFQPSKLDSADLLSAETFAVKPPEISSESLQAEKLSKHVNEMWASISTNGSSNLGRRVKAERSNEHGNHRKKCVYMVIFVVVLSALAAAHLFQKKDVVYEC